MLWRPGLAGRSSLGSMHLHRKERQKVQCERWRWETGALDAQMLDISLLEHFEYRPTSVSSRALVQVLHLLYTQKKKSNNGNDIRLVTANILTRLCF